MATRGRVGAGRRACAAVVAWVLVWGVPPAAVASVAKCEKTLVGEIGKLVAVRTNVLRKCHEAVVKGKHAGPCPDQAATAKIVGAEAKLRAKVNKACGGADQNCGIGSDDEHLAAIGWDVGACPGFAGGGCVAPITDCNDVVDCLQCVGGAAVDQAIGLAYGALTLPASGGALAKCQVAIGKQLARFLTTRMKTLAKCEQGVLAGKIVGPCPDTRAATKIAKAATQLRVALCAACGGADKACGGGDDPSLAAIGFAATCPDLDPPHGAPCLDGIDDVDALARCVGCVGELGIDCVDALSAPQSQAYPGECLALPSPTVTATPLPSATRTATPSPTPTATASADADGESDPDGRRDRRDAHRPRRSVPRRRAPRRPR